MKIEPRADWLAPGQHLPSCLRCGYSLRGLPENGRCPECGGPFDKRWGLWRQGNRLVMVPSATLPLRCVKCNADVSELTPFRLVWRRVWVFALLLTICILGLFGLLLYVLVSFLTRRVALVRVGVCPYHLRRRRRAGVATGVILGVALLFAILGMAYASPPMGFLTSLTILLAVAIWIIWGPVVRPRRIDKRFIWLAGIDEFYLAHLPALEAVEDLPGHH